MARRFELFNMRRKVQPEYLSFLAKRQQYHLLLEGYELRYLSSLGLTLADHLVLVNVHEEDLASVGANDESAPLVLVVETSHIGVLR